MKPCLHILVVEDDADTRDSLTLLLRIEGYSVSVADDGRQAIASALRDCPDVVLLDIALPGMDGYEVGKFIKQARPNKPPFIVALSGLPADDDWREDSGIDLYLMKPFDPQQLRKILGRFGRIVEEAENQPLEPLTVRSRR